MSIYIKLCGNVCIFFNFSKYFQVKFFKMNRSEVDAFTSLYKLVKLFGNESCGAELMDIDILGYFALVHLACYKDDFTSFNEKYLSYIYELIRHAGEILALNSKIDRQFYKLNDHVDLVDTLGN